MKNTYLSGYYPLFSILLFSLTFSVYGVGISLELFKGIGIYAGMREFLSDLQLKLFILILLMVLFFMLFAALKLIAETINELALLFFSRDQEGAALQKVRAGSFIYFAGALISVASLKSIIGLIVIFIITSFIYFVYFVIKTSTTLTAAGTLGLILFELIVWSALLSSVIYVIVRLYNGLMASLPILEQL
ncbi:DUF5366 family protein [Jeotgalibacillus proteolyticus]|uniref:YufK family protein n=1 Tax=Jeotgalibacillus proteolyticus TaxID=2082395 RepID=A0A2S5GAI6_9BACL|nr:DUF5366 family protein [Jeotgalibacillus proteolyticus]PPA69999.1 hypothetical protein C4B60_10385 [Jeotgalibacillus proteolyticus]